MPTSHCRLRLGDRIRIVRLPSELSQEWFHDHPDTLRLYQHLIASQEGLGRDRSTRKAAPGSNANFPKGLGCDNNSLAMDDDSWDRVEP